MEKDAYFVSRQMMAWFFGVAFYGSADEEKIWLDDKFLESALSQKPELGMRKNFNLKNLWKIPKKYLRKTISAIKFLLNSIVIGIRGRDFICIQ